jgi:hypothetical protein
MMQGRIQARKRGMDFASSGRVYGSARLGRTAAVSLCTMMGIAACLAAGAGIESTGEVATPEASQPRPRGRIGPIADPTHLRRLEFADLKYAGAFRLPATDKGDTFSSGGGPLAYHPGRNSLFAGARTGKIAEVSIPEPVVAGTIPELPVAEYLQGFADPTEGRIREVAAEGAALAGLLVYRSRLYGSGLIYYDANNTQTVSHFHRPLSLLERGAGPMRLVGKKGRSGMVAGYMALVPPEWQTKLGGPAITGQCCVPIVSRTSLGPAAFAWDPESLEEKKDPDAPALVYYPPEHPTLGPWSGSNPVYGGTIQMGGVALIAGTRTALFVGRNGTGPYCYGTGTSDKSLDNTTGRNGEKYCYDPATSDKGQHAYPYRYQMWAYDLNDWALVRAGKRDPWEIKPYGVWPFDLPFPEASTRIGGVAYDPARQRLFISQRSADREGYAYRPLIHVFEVP